MVYFSQGSENIAIQREVFASFDGSIRIYVHRKEIMGTMKEEFLKNVLCEPLNSSTLKDFASNILKVVLAVRNYEVCAGVDNSGLEQLWASDSSGKIDENIFDESRYTKTFRSNECSLLVPLRKWRCVGCARAFERQRKRIKTAFQEEVHSHTRDDYLDENQKKVKLKSLQRDFKNAQKKINYLENKITKLMEEDSVLIDNDLGGTLTEVLRDSKLTPIQQLFIQQQCKSSQCKNAKGMRWHPSIIRLALLIKSTSTAAYRALRNAGVIHLPGERTLFDYEHAVPRSDGVFTEKLNVIEEKVKQFAHADQHFHSLLMDEIYISRKLVYRKSDGQLIGYVKLDEVESEMANLSESIKNNITSEKEPEVATKILAYMVKGCTSDVKEVVAAFTTGSLTKEQLYSRTWQVIRACEGAGVKILAVVCDGSSTNRAFIAMHTPATETANGVVFDTVNMCSLDRKIFFISDPPHLLKTIRNCFAKSGQKKTCTRLLSKHGEFIEWKTIERLYIEDMHSILRRCFKLNSQNVYLNSYTCMKVAYAAQVLSRTVGLDLKDRNWPGTSATVEFILKTNDFFDCLNGAHSEAANRTANPRLASYRSVDDFRFQELKDYEKYIRDWEEEVKSLENVSDQEKAKMTLSKQTIEGIYMTVNGFAGAVKYLLSIGAKYVNARVFCQDPLEQYFSKQRASGGGRNSVTVDSFMSAEMKISTHRDLNVGRRSGNTSGTLAPLEVDDEPLTKRKKT